MEALAIILLTWLCANTTEFEKCQEVTIPTISWHSQHYLQYTIDGVNNGIQGQIAALYIPHRKHIMLDIKNKAKYDELRLTLIHELYHHLQYENKLNKKCIPANEPEAYKITKIYADKHNIIYNIPLRLLYNIYIACGGY